MKLPNKKITCALLIAAFAVALFATALPAVKAQSTDIPSFSIIWVSDTQYLSESNPAYYDSLCNWIVDNNSTYNVKMVIHTGDLVNVPDDSTQWANANQSMSILLKDKIPYCWDAGNHDFYDSNVWIGNQYAAFNPDIMQSKSYWVSDDYDGMSTAVHFNVAGWDCLIVNIAFHADDTVLAWANNLLDTYPQSHAIIATHAYIDQRCNYDSWALHLKNTVLDTHPNVFLTLNGHYHPTIGARTQSGDRNELLFNQQDADAELGADSARILTFNLAQRTLSVQTYLVYSNQFLLNDNNRFTLDITKAVPQSLFVLPEYSYGAVIALTASFAAYATYRRTRLNRLKP